MGLGEKLVRLPIEAGKGIVRLPAAVFGNEAAIENARKITEARRAAEANVEARLEAIDLVLSETLSNPNPNNPELPDATMESRAHSLNPVTSLRDIQPQTQAAIDRAKRIHPSSQQY